MKRTPQSKAPVDTDARRAVKPVICYPIDTLPLPNMTTYAAAREAMKLTGEVIVPSRDARTFRVSAGNFFRIISMDGPQVGDLNLWAEDDLSERFYSGKTRALHGTHLSTGDQMWSSFPHDTHQYFMKASPVRPGDFIEFFAEIDLLGAMSACPGGDCSAEHSSDTAACYPLKVEAYRPDPKALAGWFSPKSSAYSRSHGV